MGTKKIKKNLGRFMPNNGGPEKEARRLIATAARSKLLYAAETWGKAIKTKKSGMK